MLSALWKNARPTGLLKTLKQWIRQPARGIGAALCFSALLALAGCGDEKVQDDTIRIGVAIPNFDDTFIVYMKDAMNDYTATLDGKVDLTIVDAKEDTAKQLGQVENFIVQQMDAIVVVPVNTDATQPLTDRVTKAGIQLVYVNRRPSYLPDGVYYVGSDEKKFGETQAQYIKETMDSANIGILMGMLTQEASLKRTEGIEAFFAQDDAFNVTRKQTGQWQRALGMSVTENWLNAGDKLDVILSNNDDMALGAIQALQAAGKLDDTLVVGIDATPDGLMAVENGTLDATVFQDGGGQARGAIDAAINAVEQKPFDKITWIPAELITQENLAAFKAKKG